MPLIDLRTLIPSAYCTVPVKWRAFEGSRFPECTVAAVNGERCGDGRPSILDAFAKLTSVLQRIFPLHIVRGRWQAEHCEFVQSATGENGVLNRANRPHVSCCEQKTWIPNPKMDGKRVSGSVPRW